MKRRFFLLFILSIFAYSSEIETIKKANSLKLYNKNEWKSLLHYENELNIKDKQFILSKNNFSLKNELKNTIKGFYQSPKLYRDTNNHPQCRFPARFLFIKHELNISNSEFPTIKCLDLNTYEKKAPADDIFLIYASENVKNPSSMMGHTFLKISGKNYKNIYVEHAITFYTVIETMNLIKLFYQNIFSGMKGLFALQPYQSILKQYTDTENRNVWEFKLNLSSYRKKLIYYHIWELKYAHMKYFFTSYNCSTVIYYILSLANPEIYNDKKLWITPLDTVKFLYKYKLIKKSELFPSDEWFIKMLEENLTTKQIRNIKNIVKNKNYSKIKLLDYYSLELLKTYIELLYKTQRIEKNELDIIQNYLSKLNKYKSRVFDISKYKSPNKIPNEREFGIGYKSFDKEKYLKLSFLPASHFLNDYNREYFGESELKIFYSSILLNKNSFKLDEFTLYGMKSFVPYDILTNDLSYQFEVGFNNEYSKKNKIQNNFKIDGGIGIDYLFFKDINIFTNFNMGVAYNRDDKTHLFFNPQIGAMIYEVFNMKTIFYYQPMFVNKNIIYNRYRIKHNIFISKNYSFYFNFERIVSKKDINILDIGIKYLF